jgi:hypothetical protein
MAWPLWDTGVGNLRAGAYLGLVRPRLARWGATDYEAPSRCQATTSRAPLRVWQQGPDVRPLALAAADALPGLVVHEYSFTVVAHVCTGN